MSQPLGTRSSVGEEYALPGEVSPIGQRHLCRYETGVHHSSQHSLRLDSGHTVLVEEACVGINSIPAPLILQR